MITTWIVANIGVPFLKWSAAILAILGLILGVRRWGINVEKVEILQQNLKNQKANQTFAGSVDYNTPDNFLREPRLRKR